MKNFMVSVVLYLLLATTAFAQQISVDAKNRIKNVGHGYCGHCCIETIARHYGVTKAEGRVKTLLAKWGDDGGAMCDSDIREAFKEYGITCYTQAPDTYNYDWLNWACQRGYLCVISYKAREVVIDGQLYRIGHYVTLVGFYSDYVAVADSNWADIHWLTRDEFADIWTGGFIVAFPK